MIIDTSTLCTSDQLLDRLFPTERRPSKRTLESWRAKRIIPYIKVGNMVFYDFITVKEALAKRNYVRAL